jgi:hypothetical protein
MTSSLSTLMTNETKTKYKAIQEVRAEEAASEVIEWMKEQFLATAKAREILEDYFEGKPNDGERH